MFLYVLETFYSISDVFFIHYDVWTEFMVKIKKIINSCKSLSLETKWNVKYIILIQTSIILLMHLYLKYSNRYTYMKIHSK